MTTSLVKLIQQKIILILIIFGLVMIVVANGFHLELVKVQIDRIMAEVGALFLIIGTLHWMFESSLRKEMLKDISATALGTSRIHDSGIVDCVLNAKEVSEPNLWKASQYLIIGLHYSPRFFEHLHGMLKERCAKQKPIKVYVVHPDSVAANYLVQSKSGLGDIAAGIERIKALLKTCEPNMNQIHLSFHKRVLRYSFIYTEQCIWVKFFTNGNMRTDVPALKIQCGTPLFTFFEDDINLFMREAGQTEDMSTN